jgi:hypothetical protein
VCKRFSIQQNDFSIARAQDMTRNTPPPAGSTSFFSACVPPQVPMPPRQWPGGGQVQARPERPLAWLHPHPHLLQFLGEQLLLQVCGSDRCGK